MRFKILPCIKIRGHFHSMKCYPPIRIHYINRKAAFKLNCKSLSIISLLKNLSIKIYRKTGVMLFWLSSFFHRLRPKWMSGHGTWQCRKRMTFCNIDLCLLSSYHCRRSVSKSMLRPWQHCSYMRATVLNTHYCKFPASCFHSMTHACKTMAPWANACSVKPFSIVLYVNGDNLVKIM